MALISRVSLAGPPDSNPEDFFSASLGVIFPDDVMNQHGDSTHSLTYNSPHLPKPLSLTLCDPVGESDRKLFSHFLWNASLQLAELIEASTLSVPLSAPSPLGPLDVSSWSVRGKSVVELGSGTALPSIMSALLGASIVCITDYPAPPVLSNLRANLVRCHKPEFVPPSSSIASEAFVEGHAWGELDNDFATQHKGKFDRVFACDCLWMPWQHSNLRRSIAHFMSSSLDARAWVVAGFHTGREKMRGFFDADGLRDAGLELERIWERDCDGIEREWTLDRGIEDVSERKRWLVIGIIRRVQGG